MTRPLRLLVVEDSPEDCDLVLREVRRAGYDVLYERVDSELEFQAALRRQEWDLVLSDFSMPQFNGIAAFEILKDRGIDIPFIFVSGRIGEDRAAEAMKRGASDYILKDKLARLAPAIERELADAEVRRQRRQMATRLKESEEKFRYLIENSIQSIVIHRDLKPLFVNQALVETFGYGSVQEVLALDSVLALFAPELHSTLKGYAEARMAGRDAPRQYEFEGVRRDGRRIWLENISWKVNWEGQPAIQSVYVDITRRRQAEEAFRSQKRLLETVFDSLPVWISVTDPEGRFVLANRLMAERHGLAEEGLIGRSRREIGIGTPAELERFVQSDNETLREGKVTVDADVALTLPGGNRRRLHVTRIPLRHEDGQVQGLVHVTEDITDRLSLEEQFRQAQKMESIGRLAGGVAHDFNNILAVILAYSETVLERLHQDDPLKEDIQGIQEAGRRGAGLTRQLLAFSRRQILDLRPLNLSDVVSNLQKFVGTLIGEDIRLDLALDPKVPPVLADAGQIEQVVMNLAVNARDAMPDGGRLLIETDAVTLDEASASRHLSLAPGEYVRLTVTDSGTGMDDETQKHIFEPFFTTKEQGKGTGLGLATVYGIVQQLGGGIWVYSEKDKGTAFKIYLPRAAQAAPAASATAQKAEELKGSGTILVVEDDTAVRQAVRRILEVGGYRVREAGRAADALRLLAESHQEIDLVLSDVVMPEMSGLALADQKDQLYPHIPMVLMSGYTEEAVSGRAPLKPDRVLVQKPFTRATLLAGVRQALDLSKRR